MHFCNVAQQKLPLLVTFPAALPLTDVCSVTWGSVQLGGGCSMLFQVIYLLGDVIELLYFILVPLPLADWMLELGF